MDWSFTIGSLTFGVLDIAVVVIVLIGAISGCITGFSRSAARLIGFVLAIPVSLLFTKNAAEALAAESGFSYMICSLIAFVGVALLVYIILCIFGSQLANVLSASSALHALDSILGFIWGLVGSAVTLSIILMILNYQPFIDFSGLTESSLVISDIIEPLFPSVLDIISGVSDGI